MSGPCGATSAEHMLLFGIGAGRLSVIRDLAERGKMPTFARLLREGAVATDCANTSVNKTHPGWITIASGASTGTHRVHCWRFSDDGLSGFRMSLLGAQRQAEYLWEAAERQGKRVIVLAWPDSWPSRLQDGLQVGGACLGPNATFYEGPIEMPVKGGPIHRFAVGSDEYFATDPQGGMSPLAFANIGASGAQPAGITAGLAARLPLQCAYADRALVATPVYWLIVPEGDAGALLYTDGVWSAPIARLEVGRWTERIDVNVKTASGALPAAFHIKLLSLDASQRSAALYVTPICALDDGRIHPPDAAPEIAQLRSLALPTPVFLLRYAATLLDFASQRELLEMSNRWYVEAATTLLRRPFDLFAMMSNNIDWAEHAIWQKPAASKEACIQFLMDCYADLDRMVGDILAALPANTAVCLVSEHGAIDPWDTLTAPSPERVLYDAGLLVFTEDRRAEVLASTAIVDSGTSLLAFSETGRVDTEKSHAYFEEGLVHVLPKRPGTEAERALRAERIREAVSALSAATIPGTKERVFTVVLPWEEAGPFGFHGEPLGDIVVFRRAAFGGIHGDVYPLDVEGWSSLKSLLLLWGAGVRAGAQELRPTRLEDVAPTVALLLGIEPPRQCEGRPLWSLLGTHGPSAS